MIVGVSKDSTKSHRKFKTKYELHQLILQLAEDGVSIILISSDMPEIVQVRSPEVFTERFAASGPDPPGPEYAP